MNAKEGWQQSEAVSNELPAESSSPSRLWRILTSGKTGAVAIFSAAALAAEVMFSPVQAIVFRNFDQWFGQSVTKAPSIKGPIGARVCYDRIQSLREIHEARGNTVSPQQPWMQYTVPLLGTLSPVFNWPANPGLRILDSTSSPVFDATQYTFPRYKNFEEIPPILARTLAHSEDHRLLDFSGTSSYNAAVDIPRMAEATAEHVGKKFGLVKRATGGSGIVIQTVKQQHDLDGKTDSAAGKARQGLVGSIGFYLDDMDTTDERKGALVYYMNHVAPLAGHPAYGEVIGFRAGMAIWFGNTDYDEVMRSGVENDQSALVYRQYLTLVKALPAPTEMLKEPAGFLKNQIKVDAALPGLVEKGIITPSFAEKVRNARIDFSDLGKNPVLPPEPPREKWLTSHRNAALRALDLSKEGPAVANGCDATLLSTRESALEHKMLDFFGKIKNDPGFAASLGLFGTRLMRPEGQENMYFAARIVKVDGESAKVVLNVDTLGGPVEHFDLNEGARFNTGSFAKWPTTATYLDIFEKLHGEFAGLTPDQLAKVPVAPTDKLTRWTVDYLKDPAKDHSLKGLLDAALERVYSAAPRGFFTSGGVLRPANFQSSDNGKSYTVKEALARSVNLVFVGMAEDIREHKIWHGLKTDPRVLDSASTDPAVQQQRTKLMDDYALWENGIFLYRAFTHLQGKTRDEMAEALIKRRAPVPLAETLFAVDPDASPEKMKAFIRKNCGKGCKTGDKELDGIYKKHAPRGMYDIKGYLQKSLGHRFEALTADPSLFQTDALASLLAAEERFSLPDKLMALYMWRYPQAEYKDAVKFLVRHCTDCKPWDDYRPAYAIYKDRAFDPSVRIHPFSEKDREYLTGQNRAVLGLPAKLLGNPDVKWSQVLAKSKDDLLEADAWRRLPGKVPAQQRAIRIMLERSGLQLVNDQWRSMGYPYQFNAYSVGFPLGVEGSNSAFATDFMALLLTGGRSVHAARFSEIKLAMGTPFQTVIKPRSVRDEQVLHPLVAELVLETARGGVESPGGTSSRLKGLFRNAAGDPIIIGGKTGTNGEKSDANAGKSDGKTPDRIVGYSAVLRDPAAPPGTGCAVNILVMAYDPNKKESFTSGLAVRSTAGAKEIIEEACGFSRPPQPFKSGQMTIN